MDSQFLNMIRKHLADTVELDAVGLQPNSFMSEDDILEHQRKAAELAQRIRSRITDDKI